LPKVCGRNVVKEGEDSELGDWEYASVTGGIFLCAGVYSIAKGGMTLTKTRGMDPKRVTEDEDVGAMLNRKALEEMSRPYVLLEQGGESIPYHYEIGLETCDLVTIGQALSASEHHHELWTKGLAGRWSPELGNPNALVRRIDLERLGTKRCWIPGREMDWQTTLGPNGELCLANRVRTLVPTIPNENPEPRGTMSKMYDPDWVDPELGEDVSESEEQEAIRDA
jgi:hypothetical protein